MGTLSDLEPLFSFWNLFSDYSVFVDGFLVLRGGLYFIYSHTRRPIFETETCTGISWENFAHHKILLSDDAPKAESRKRAAKTEIEDPPNKRVKVSSV